MILLELEQACILELIKASLFDYTPQIPKEVNWEKVFEIAKNQFIVPLLTPSVPPEHRDKWFDTSCHGKAYFIQMIHEQNSLVKLFIDNNIPFVILKGTAAAVYYPNPQTRTFGDIDFYILEDYLQSARNLLEKSGYKLIHNNERHYGYYKNAFEYELHTRFSCHSYNDIDHIIINGLNNVVYSKLGNSSFPCLPTYENGIVLLGHIMQHIKDYGVGFRQIIDWMMFVQKELDDSAWENCFRKFAVDAGLEKLAITVTYMCKKWLGLPAEISWCNCANEQVADQLLFRLFNDGNFGQDRAPFENVRLGMKNEGVFKYLHKAGLENWPLAQKYRFFRLFAWIYQFCRFIHSGVSGLIKGKKVFRKDKHNMNIEELWKELE